MEPVVTRPGPTSFHTRSAGIDSSNPRAPNGRINGDREWTDGGTERGWMDELYCNDLTREKRNHKAVGVVENEAIVN